MATPTSTLSPRRRENLALCFQELITVGERLRSGRQQVSDAVTFRGQLKEALRMADAEARRQGYTADDIALAVFAVVGYLDESILTLRSPVFVDWPRQPLQEELFGHQIAGEVFFQNLQRILGRDETQELADLLEVYHLCLLLGFAGRYSIGGKGELKVIIDQVAAKILRIRQPSPELSPAWRLPQDAVQVRKDPWVKRVLIATISVLSLVVLLYIVYHLSLWGSVKGLDKL